MSAKGQLNQIIFAGPPRRERHGYGTVVNVGDVQVRHVDGIKPRLELSVSTTCRIEPVVLAAQERTRLFRISAVKNAVMFEERIYAKAHSRPFPIQGKRSTVSRDYEHKFLRFLDSDALHDVNTKLFSRRLRPNLDIDMASG
jgi:hypothetical protein